MRFLLADDAQIPETVNGSGIADAPEPPTENSSLAAGVAITPGPMMAPVLGRMVAMLLSNESFSFCE